MKPIKFIPSLLILASIISACAQQPVATVNPVDIQSTAAAAAFTIVAETQAAIPTSTTVPPTEIPTNTPLPTETPVPLPTSAELATPTTAAVAAGNGNATVDPCANRQLSGSPKGKETVIRLANKTKVPIKVSLYLAETAGHGECGYRDYEISKNNDVVISDLVQGCYYLWAWSDDPKGKFSSNGSGCINNPDKWTFEISESMIKFVGP
jgi:hypothetical protein